MRHIERIASTVFLLLLLLPLVCMNRQADAVSENENRALAPSPLEAINEGAEFSSAVDAYISDRLGFRNQMLTARRLLNARVFRDAPDKRVIVGEDGWLFYHAEENGDGNTMHQYLGSFLYSDEQLQQIAENLERTRAYLAERGCEFVLMIAPNKETVYADRMPVKYRLLRGDNQSCTVQLIDYLRQNTDLRIVWPYEELMSFRREHPDTDIYLRLDTHWNGLGAYIGAGALLRELGIELPAPVIEDFMRTVCRDKDLYMMMGLTMLNREDIDYIPDWYPLPTAEFINGGFTGEWEYYTTDADARRVLICRDSYASAMHAILGSYFSYMDLCHFTTFRQELIDEKQPDVFVKEITERYQEQLLSFCLQEEPKS